MQKGPHVSVIKIFRLTFAAHTLAIPHHTYHTIPPSPPPPFSRIRQSLDGSFAPDRVPWRAGGAVVCRCRPQLRGGCDCLFHRFGPFHFSRISHVVLSSIPPHTCRVPYSAWWPCSLGANWCLRSDAVRDMGLQGFPLLTVLLVAYMVPYSDLCEQRGGWDNLYTVGHALFWPYFGAFGESVKRKGPSVPSAVTRPAHLPCCLRCSHRSEILEIFFHSPSAAKAKWYSG